MSENKINIIELFNGIDFKAIESNNDFKEDSVREVLILPILKSLNYKESDIVRSKQLEHPFIKIGSNKKIPIKLIPDYLLKVNDNYAWVLDAKSPKQNLLSQDNIEQVYSYAAHPEIRSTYFALCNGLEFVIFRRENTNKPILYFKLEDIEYNWEKLNSILSSKSFINGKELNYEKVKYIFKKSVEFDYNKRPLLDEIEVKKQSTKRHFGVHGYFTKQSWNVVSEYIKNYSKPGDTVLDPFGGSGVTAIESIMNNRKSISIDINPLAVFLVQSLIEPVDFTKFNEEFNKIKDKYLKNEPVSKKDIKEYLKKYPSPSGWKLPKGSDVEFVEELFSDKQKAQLAYLKHLILQIKNKGIKESFLLMFSGLVTKINLTYHTSKFNEKSKGGGDAAPFRYYRYRIAPKPVELEIMKYFELRFKKIRDAKKEIEYFINEDTIKDIQIIKGTSTDLSFIKSQSIDYIYTDPPYGKKIPYLDLSIMWNAWLDFKVDDNDYELEAIEGGSKQKTKFEYNTLIAKSIEEMYRVLKFDRWMSFVFAHKDPEFWHLIIETAEACGFEYIGAVPQKNGQTSFKKRQNPFTVLSGQLIINFKKIKNPKAILKANLGMNIAQIVMQTIEGVIAKNEGASIEQINDELIIRGLELGFLDLLKKEYDDLTPLLRENFDYDISKKMYFIKESSKFTTSVDVKLRIRYYILSFLRRKEKNNEISHFDDIILYILPLLKNGVTPENQTILSVLEDIADRIDDSHWKLKSEDLQTKIF